MDSKSTVQKLLSYADIALDGSRAFDPQVHDTSVYRDALWWGSLGLGDAYVAGKWDCDRLDEFFSRVLSAKLEHKVGMLADGILWFRDKLLNLQSIQRALQVGEHHYDLGNTLYERMLGNSMAYSSAYYGAGATALDEAQIAKFDLICKRLELAPGMKILEIGCGWGTFAAYAAKKYGVHVTGVTVSKEQLAYAKDHCKGLSVEFYFGDYRTLPQEFQATFDRAVSVEMIEAVGPKNLRTYMSVVQTMLKPNGTFLVQAIIGLGQPDVWISTRIFPNGVLPSMSQITTSMQNLFHIRDTEYFGSDYDRTLMAWDENFRANWNNLCELKDKDGAKLYNERFYRMWRYYLSVCAGSFRAKKIDVCHLVLTRE